MTDTQRMLWIDVARTVAILLMVLYHLVFDLQYWYGWSIDVTQGTWFLVGRSAAVLFLILVGVSFVVSARRRTPRQIQWRAFQRSAVILSWAVAITVATYGVDSDTYIRFGILHCIGVSILLLLPLYRLGMWNMSLGILWLAGTPLFMGTANNEFLLPLGRIPLGFVTLDYYPLFPWAGLVVLGAGLGALLLNFHKPIQRSPHALVHILTFPGRHALAIYLVHQPVLLGFLWLLHR